ncbi:glycoside hydrolase family 2 [Saccharobesus litoralis]|uniref:Glycoside hydrolase family 2 n=1 Tax=Saccharobesus litoralis TaxID=2172099 RepID=A0A2S0VLC6_9ALTE|nr:sugar-binding domain-containing protein [Saccharobesus litoralis]AWB65013.1 glycoside hydrolase family 2 [Saccharobesus litoralis]
MNIYCAGYKIVQFVLIFAFLITSCGENPKPEPDINQPAVAAGKTKQREVDFNFGWKFILADEENAQSVTYKDDHWQAIRLPHDWSIELAYTQQQTAGATGYLPGGIGWYRKQFKTPKSDMSQILFDGIYNHSKVWINGHLLGYRPYGYVPFHYDLTPYLYRDGRINTLAVRVDRSRYVDSRWYTGSGIYRNVKLINTDKIHVPIWGQYVTTPHIDNTDAQVQVQTELKNSLNKSVEIDAITDIQELSGQVITSRKTTATLDANQMTVVKHHLNINHPKLWDVNNPNLYLATTRFLHKGKLVDQITTRFGIRSFRNDPAQGFFLNGQPLKIKGVNLHHDGGLVGAAVPKGVWQRRLTTLKQAGVNAIRTAHNAPSQAFLELCDEMGFLVQNEIFDEWDNPKDKRKNFNLSGASDYVSQSYSDYFAEWAEQDLKNTLKRDRNHTSIFQWSIGNEIEWTYPRYTSSTGYWDKDKPHGVNYYWTAPYRTPEQIKTILQSKPIKGAELAKTAQNLAKWVREMDETRVVTANLVVPSVSQLTGYGQALDVIGYSYRQAVYEYGRKHFPDKMILGTENWVQWHEWLQVLNKNYIAGIFVWTGINYLGESNGRWPKKGSGSGMLDFAGFTKPSYHMMKTVWSDEPHIYVTTIPMADSEYKVENDKIVEKVKDSWKREKWGWREVNQHWNYAEPELISVEVYTNVEQIELFLNGKSLGVRHLADNADRILKWAVPYQKGELVARGKVDGKPIEYLVRTAAKPAAIKLSVDKSEIVADRYDVAHITAQVVDENGIPVQHQETQLQFSLSEQLRLLGVDNGASDNIQKHLNTQITTHKGKALLIVQSKQQTGVGIIKAQAEGLLADKISFELKDE